jgi:putative tryptophan/tyrosine transport system substrate-binding protein
VDKGGEKDMKKKITVLTVSAMVFALCVSAGAQQPGKVPRIGYLADAGSSLPQAFLQGLRDLGYIEGKNIAFEYRTTEGKSERRPDQVAELVHLKVDIIVADGTGPTLAAKKATSAIPIVMTSSSDPVGTGLIASLAWPGGNVTGLTSVTGELGGKLLELLKEIVPRLTRVAIALPGPDSPASKLFLKETETPGQALKIHLITLWVSFNKPEDFAGAFRVASKERANALLVRVPPATFSPHLKQFAELTVKSRLPAISPARNWVDAGGLMSYGADQNVGFRRAATYVDKILKGTKPADLPVEAPMKLELVINLKTAKQIGLTIPPNVLARADRVIR